MAVPKKRVSAQRRNKRRSAVEKITPPTLVECAHCGELKVPHRVCKACGKYGTKKDVRQVIAVKEI
ncbi:MAG: 50S ribosomal protein L32 [Oscillospiraceae bacterium]|jgi:large subunit ribosomal protein L32|nr:50S ribosomal protein L32 [Oscillospiraceae bacterium]